MFRSSSDRHHGVLKQTNKHIQNTGTLWNSSSSIGTTAYCELWPVEQCPSIFSYLPPTLSIFSLPAPEDLFLLPLSILFLVLPLLLVPSSSWVKIFLGILSSSILSRWPNQLILCPFIHFIILFVCISCTNKEFGITNARYNHEDYQISVCSANSIGCQLPNSTCLTDLRVFFFFIWHTGMKFCF